VHSALARRGLNSHSRTLEFFSADADTKIAEFYSIEEVEAWLTI
jgi:hypothetical protein